VWCGVCVCVCVCVCVIVKPQQCLIGLSGLRGGGGGRWPVCNTCQLAKCTSFYSRAVGHGIEQRTGVGGQHSNWKMKK
jgi:hypothetical protein